MNSLINLFDGNKTNIGAILLVIAAILTEVVVGIFEYNPDWILKLIESLNWFGGFFGAVGLTHKGIKKAKT